MRVLLVGNLPEGVALELGHEDRRDTRGEVALLTHACNKVEHRRANHSPVAHAGCHTLE